MTCDRFDLEQLIMKNWQTADDIELLFRRVCNYGLEGDELENVLMGLATLHNLRSQELFDMFEKMISNGTIK